MKQIKNNGTSPTIEFAVSNNSVVNGTVLSSDATSQQRCAQIQNYLSGVSIKEGVKQTPGKLALEISFLASKAENQQMAQGKTAEIMLSRASLEYFDASLQGSKLGIELRCPKAFAVSCTTKEFDGEKECVSYKVSASDQSCTFHSTAMPFEFSDHKNAQLDIVGELRFASSGAQIEFSKISLTGLY